VRKFARNSVASKRSVPYAILDLFKETVPYKPAFHVNSAILDSFVYVYSAIVDSFVIPVVSFFLEKHYIPQYYR